MREQATLHDVHGPWFCRQARRAFERLLDWHAAEGTDGVVVVGTSLFITMDYGVAVVTNVPPPVFGWARIVASGNERPVAPRARSSAARSAAMTLAPPPQ